MGETTGEERKWRNDEVLGFEMKCEDLIKTEGQDVVFLNEYE